MMNDHIKDFYSQFSDESPKGNYYKVIALHEAADINWTTLSQQVKNLPKGWFELCELTPEDRIQFSLDYWIAKLPYHPHIDEALAVFFNLLDNIGVFLLQQKYDDPFEVQMVYSLSNNRGFYHGSAPATEDEIIDLQKLFSDYILPEDYLAFLAIHNGFCKTTDCTGIIPTKDMQQNYQTFQKLLGNRGQVTTKSGEIINPRALIPFYESFGMPYYQCFWEEWHPEQEMGNVYYSCADNTISDPLKGSWGSTEQMAYPTFLDWLIFYLEQVET